MSNSWAVQHVDETSLNKRVFMRARAVARAVAKAVAKGLNLVLRVFKLRKS